MAQLANLGYFALIKEAAKGTALTPDTYVPLYEDTLTTELSRDEDNPIVGQKFARFNVYQGQRFHTGTLQVLAEPNIAGYVLDAIMTKGTTTGSDPYTHPFTYSGVTDPNSYTFDINRGRMVDRFIGAEISQVGIAFQDNKMVFDLTVSAQKNFSIREVDSVAAAVVTLKTNYDPTPTDGLVASDLIGFYDVSAGTYITNLTVASVDNATDFTASGSPALIDDGDLVFLRPATPSLSLLTPFLWARSEFRFGVDASTALSAAHTPVEPGSAWSLLHPFEGDSGSKRSGSFDPAVLNRLQGDAEFTVTQEFDNLEDYNRAMTNAKHSCIIRHFSGTAHELRVTINNIHRIDPQARPLNTGEIIFDEQTYKPIYDTSDAQGIDVKVINALSTI